MNNSFFFHLWNIPRHVLISSCIALFKWFSSIGSQWISLTLYIVLIQTTLLLILQWPLESWLRSGPVHSVVENALFSPKQNIKSTEIVSSPMYPWGQGHRRRKELTILSSYFFLQSIIKETRSRYWELVLWGWDTPPRPYLFSFEPILFSGSLCNPAPQPTVPPSHPHRWPGITAALH